MATDEKPPGTPATSAKSADPTGGLPTSPPPDASKTSVEPKPADSTGKAGDKSVANTAPAASTDNPFRIRRRELEAQLKQQEADKSRHSAIAQATTRAMLGELRDQEARFGQSGLSPLTPRGNLLFAGAMQAEYPDDHLRWVNETVPGRAEFLQSIGYERVPGSRRGGDLVLWKIPREKWGESVAAKDAQTDRMLRKATSGSRADTVAELQDFFDKHGVNVDVEKMIPREV